MQNRSKLWRELAASGNVKMETVVVIDGREYAPESDVIVSRSAGQNALSLGNAITATVRFSVQRVDGAEIPNASVAVVKVRYVDGGRASEWLTVGVFYVSRRRSDAVSGILEFQGYDAMLKADAPFPSLSGFPKAMNGAVTEIARNMGVEVDTRTWDGFPTGNDYYVPLPANGKKMISVLGYIGGVCGGNWVITPRNKLRLVPLASASGAASAEDKAEIAAVLSGVATGEPVSVTGVAVSGQNGMIAGTDSGAVIAMAQNPYVTQTTLNALLTRYGGLTYKPYEIKSGVYDPAAEIGDYLISREDVASVVWSENATYAPMFRGDVSAPFASETPETARSVTDAISETDGGYEDLSVRFYKFVSQSAVTVGDGQSAEIINFDYAGGSGQDVIFHAEVKHVTETTETGNAADGWTCTDAVLTITHYINGAEVTSYRPVKTETDGENLLHLNYHWKNGRYAAGNFRAVLSLSGGSVTIAAGDARAYIIGQGDVGGAWSAIDAGEDGRWGGWISEDGLLFIGAESYPDKMEYVTGDALDLTGLVVKAYYGDGTEKNVTAQCVVEPAHGDALEEGETVVSLFYTENDKEFRDSFSVYCNANHILYIEVVTPPTRTEYFPGETLDLTGIVVTAFYEDGAEADVTADCAFTPPDGTTLTGDETITANAAYTEGGETFAAYFDVNVKAIRITAYPVKSDYFVGEALDYTGLEVTEAVSDGTWNDITAECEIIPAEGTEITEPGDIMVDVRYDGKSLGAFWVATAAVKIAELPDTTNYAVGDDLDYTGLEIIRYLPDGTPEDITPYCTFDPPEGTEITGDGPITVTVSYEGETVATFEVEAVSVIASGDGWRLYSNGLLDIYCVGAIPDYSTTSNPVRSPWVEYAWGNIKLIKTATIRDSVTSIGGCAFEHCEYLMSVTIPNSVASIGYSAFYQCVRLANVTIPDGVTSISREAFHGCSSLTEVTIPSSVTSIGVWAFRGSGLTSITIPDSVTSIGAGAYPLSGTRIGGGAFLNCKHLTSINVESGNVNYASESGVLFNKTKTVLYEYPLGKAETAYVVPDSVTIIAASSFLDCKNLTSVAIGNSVTSIREGAFYNCGALAEVSIPLSVRYIYETAFHFCSSLTDVYYSGTQTQWQKITIKSYNTPLTSATIHYNSSGPT